MSETYIVTAKTIDEAIAIANKQYADAEHEISYDIIEMPKKGFLGIGSKEAKIKVTVNEIRDADLESIVSDLRSMKLHTDRDGRQNEQKKRPAEQRSADNKPEAKQNQQRQPKGERPAENKPEAKQNQQRQPKPERPSENKPAEAKQNQQRQPKPERPAENKPAEAKQNQQRQPKPEHPAENKPAEAKQNQQRQPKPERPAETKPEAKQNQQRQPKPERPAETKPEAKQNQQRQPKPDRPAENKPAETAEKAKQNAYAADAMPREHTEVIVSAPVGLFDLPAKEPPKSPFAAVEAETAAETEAETVAETAAETVTAVKAEPAVQEPAESTEYTEDTATEEEAKDTSVKVAVSEEEMTYALEFANTLLRNMQIDARAERGVCPEGETFETTEDADVYPRIEIVGSGTGILIGHHGETLDAIQYLVNLSAIRKARKANGHGDYVKIVVDVENYRTKREETLRTLARRMAARAVKTKKNVFLEPMNAYERRIIHSELQTYENVSTHSVGADKNRKIIITYEGPDKQPSGSRRRSGKDRPEGARTENGAAQKQERGERQHPGKSGGGERTERPRPRKPQKMPIEKLPDFLAASSTEPDEVLGIED